MPSYAIVFYGDIWSGNTGIVETPWVAFWGFYSYKVFRLCLWFIV